MERTSNGYTIVEVMIVLAVSTLLLFAAIRVFSGSQGETQFSQAMQDINSKIQNYINQIKAGNYQGSEGFKCDVQVEPQGIRPYLTPSGTDTVGTNEKCVFLGRAIQVIEDGGTMYVYTVIGTRNTYDAANNDTGRQAASLNQTQSEPALVSPDTPGQKWVLTDDYNFPYGVTLVSAKQTQPVPPPGQEKREIIGVYNSLNSTISTSGNTSVELVGYPYSTNDPNDFRSQNVRLCLEQQAVGGNPCDTAADIREWALCFHDSGSDRAATLTINSRPTGVITRLNFEACT